MATNIENHLGTARTNRGISVAELASRIGVTRQTVYAIEAGSYVPNTEVALRIARELQVPVEELFRLAEAVHSDDSDLIPTEYLSIFKPRNGQAVRTCKVGSKWISIPVSATPYYLPEADGVMQSPSNVHLFSQASAAKRLIIAGCDPAAGLLAHAAERMGGVDVVHAPASSQLALTWLKAGKVHVAGSHLEDSRTGEFNLPFIRRQFAGQDMAVVTFAEWEAGLVVACGNPKAVRRIEDLAGKGIRFVNREPGSGSRSLLDKLLRKANLSAAAIGGYDRVVAGHLAAAGRIFAGDADCCLATEAAARAYGLDFIALHRERYDFILRRETFELPQAQAFLDVLQRAELRRKLAALAGYDTAKTGSVID